MLQIFIFVERGDCINIAIIDADLIGRKKHRFPNLVCMKISGYYKQLNCNVNLVIDYNALKTKIYDKIFLSKVFTDTEVPQWVLELKNIEYGGTGFYYDNAPKLPNEIEHHMPDYHLYDEWVEWQLINKKGKKLDYKYYLDYSIGFTTRGCFRQCPFCVNRNYKKVELHSPLSEFLDPTRKKICLLDDNVLGSPNWKEVFEKLQSTKKPFQFKQGMDERILTDEKCEILFKSKYDGDYIFAFDNIEDYELIETKLKLIRNYTEKIPKFYCFCGFDRNNKWDNEFWKQDIKDLLKRIELLMNYHSLPYIMRFNRYVESPYYGTYVNIASWCNQPSFFKKKSFKEWCDVDNERKGGNSATKRYYNKMISEIDGIEKYTKMKWI